MSNKKVSNLVSSCAGHMIEYYIIDQLSKSTLDGLKHISSITPDYNSNTIDIIASLQYSNEELTNEFNTDNPESFNYNLLRRNFEIKSFKDGKFKNITLSDPQIQILSNDIVSINFILVDYSINKTSITINDIYIVTPKLAAQSLTSGRAVTGKHLSNNIVSIANDLNDFRAISVSQYLLNPKQYEKLAKQYNKQFTDKRVKFAK